MPPQMLCPVCNSNEVHEDDEEGMFECENCGDVFAESDADWLDD